MTDLAVRLRRDGYRAVHDDRRDRRGGDTYATRMLGRRAVVVRGEAGARLFYDEAVVRRAGAVPAPLALLLFGRGSIHGLDGREHRDRKLMFLDAVSPDGLDPVAEAVCAGLEARTSTWPGQEVHLFPELVEVYGGAALSWVGIDCSRRHAAQLSRRLADIVDGFGFATAAYPRAWAARLATDRWARHLVEDVRRGRVAAREGTALSLLAGSGLPPATAAVELGNLLRPTVAVAWLGTFAALALHRAPEWRDRLAAPTGGRDRFAFAQEVRRTVPFAPALAGLVRTGARHDGVALREGERLVLDVIGTDHDPASWDEPLQFRPERFLGAPPRAFALVAQGGGHPSGHRCPGENLTLRILVETLRVLAGTDYQPDSEPDADLARIPTLPASGLRVTGARPRVPPGPGRSAAAG